jgi:PKHD-type hydroxylase
VRVASFFWVESIVRDDGERPLLLDLDMAIEGVERDAPVRPPCR